MHEGTWSPSYGALCSHTHVRNSKPKRLVLDSFYITLGPSPRYVCKKLNLLGTFSIQWRKTGMTSGREQGLTLGWLNHPLGPCLLLPLMSRRAVLLNHHGYVPAVRGEVSPVPRGCFQDGQGCLSWRQKGKHAFPCPWFNARPHFLVQSHFVMHQFLDLVFLFLLI